MRKYPATVVLLLFVFSVLLTSCGTASGGQTGDGGKDILPSASAQTRPAPEKPKVDQVQAKTPEPAGQNDINLAKVRPNEDGKIMIVMFHNFVVSFKPSKYDDGAYTTTFDAFRKLLDTLYQKNYRPVSMSDFLNNNINVPAGCIPIVFTFDDATPGQFNLLEKDGQLAANPQTAVGIMEEFNKMHPDFGLKGTFYINLGNSPFEGKGTVRERLKYLIDKGFEIGNHTFDHVSLKGIKTADGVQKEIGSNQKKMLELIPGYRMTTFSLPFGEEPKGLEQYVVRGEYQGVKYENLAVMAVGWDPTVPSVSVKFNPQYVHRVRASGINAVQADLEWWLKNLPRSEQYVSDGNPETVTVPKSKEGDVDRSRLGDRKLIIY